jgi:TolB protein
MRLVVLVSSDRRQSILSISMLSLVLLWSSCQSVAPIGGEDQTAHGTLSASPASLSFGNVVVGQNASLMASLMAAGAPVDVSSVTSTSGEFAVSGISFPVSLDAGQSLNFTVTFAPAVPGAASATLRFSSNADNSPAIQSADGTGLIAPEHRVDRSWNPSPSDGVVGYNVYRRTTEDYSRINTALEASMTYTDSLVSAGTTYYYVVTAVNGSGMESPFSDRVKAQIPTP